MTSNGQRETARIYQFPLERRRQDVTLRPTASVVDQSTRQPPAADFGSAWYHGAAIETEQAHPHGG